MKILFFLSMHLILASILKTFCNCRYLGLFNKREDVYVLSVARTPIGSFQKGLASCAATELGGVAIKAAVEKAMINPERVEECFMGLVVSANVKQAPAKQAALYGGLSKSTPCTTINKVCASGMKSIMLASQTIALGQQNVVCAGGMESMSNTPFYLPRKPLTYGGFNLLDSIVTDGLTDSHYLIHMGTCAEKTVSDLNISREAQDSYAQLSYERSRTSAERGIFKSEISPVRIADKKAPNGYVDVVEDEEYKKVDFARFPKLKPAFRPIEEGGTITAANASTLNDGAAAMIMASGNFLSQNPNIRPLARIIDFADAALDQIDFSIAPHLAINKLLTKTNLKLTDIALWEINEAFSAVVLANVQLLGLSLDQVNIHGGAVSCGHPIGMSGARITNHLILSLEQGQKGIAAICNGGGGASAILVERL